MLMYCPYIIPHFCILAKISGMISLFIWLQEVWANWQFLMDLLPPLDKGMIWSKDKSLYLTIGFPHMAQFFPEFHKSLNLILALFEDMLPPYIPIPGKTSLILLAITISDTLNFWRILFSILPSSLELASQ